MNTDYFYDINENIVVKPIYQHKFENTRLMGRLHIPKQEKK